MGRLEGKVAFITGTGGGGMGRAAALLFAREGARVAGCDLNVAENAETTRLVEAAGGEMLGLQPLDLGDGAQVRDALAAIIGRFGKLDILYNNAGAQARECPIDELSWDDWRYTLRNELDIVYQTCHYAWPHLKARGGAVINASSTSGLQGHLHSSSAAHAAAKGAIIAMTRQLAVDGAAFGIRVNAISPGRTMTAAVAKRFPSAAALREYVAGGESLLGRLAAPEEVAKLALFLASDDSSFVTGANYVIDGGRTAH